MKVTPKLHDCSILSGVAASTGVTYNQRPRKMRFVNVGLVRAAKLPTANAETYRNVGNTIGGIGSGSTAMLVNSFREARQTTTRPRERCAQMLFTKVVVFLLIERIVIKISAKSDVAMMK